MTGKYGIKVYESALRDGLGKKEASEFDVPVSVFVDAIKLASAPREPVAVGREAVEGMRGAVVQDRYAAIDHLTAWWNKTAPESLQGAFGFMFYVRLDTPGEAVEVWWASGDPEEGYVIDDALRQGSAIVLGRVSIDFIRKPVTTANWFEAQRVDGSHGVSGGLPINLTGGDIVTADAYDALHDFPSRFPDLWAELQNV